MERLVPVMDPWNAWIGIWIRRILDPDMDPSNFRFQIWIRGMLGSGFGSVECLDRDLDP